MSSSSEQDRKIQTLIEKIANLDRGQKDLQTNINNLGERTVALQNQTPTRGQIDNLLRNSKFRHSWDTWTNAAPVAGNQQQEAAHIYTSEPEESVEVFTGAITTGTNILTIGSGAELFNNPADAALEIVIEGAGASGADLATTITTVNSTTEVIIGVNASSTVSNARVRWRLPIIPKTSTKTGTANINAALKASGHTHFNDPLNINDPAWDNESGNAALGSLNTINFPLGFWNKDTSSFVFQNLIEPSKTYTFICRIARKNSTVKLNGFLGVALCDNSAGKRQVIEGGRFTLDARVNGVAVATTTSNYRIIGRTDQGKTLESNTFSLARPSDSSFVANAVYAHLSWSALPGVRIYEVWRETAGVYQLLTEITNGSRIYLDQNAVRSTGSGFPAADLQRRKAEGFTLPRDLETVVAQGDPAGWDFVEIPITIPASYDTRATTEQWLRIFLTDAADREVTDASCSAASVVAESESADFVAEDVGLSVRIVSGNSVFNGTIATVTDQNTIEVSGAVGFTATDATLTIIGGGRGGLLIGECGLSLTPGTWAANHDDNQTARSPAVNPNGSTTGGNNPGGELPPDGGGVLCVRNDMRVRLFSTDRTINELPIRYVQVGNATDGGSIRPNIVLKKTQGKADTLIELSAGGKTVFVTPLHPFFRSFEDFDRPTAAHLFKKGDSIAMNIDGVDVLSFIESDPVIHFGVFDVENLDSLSPDHIFIVECFYCHNRKAGEGYQ